MCLRKKIQNSPEDETIFRDIDEAQFTIVDVEGTSPEITIASPQDKKGAMIVNEKNPFVTPIK